MLRGEKVCGASGIFIGSELMLSRTRLSSAERGYIETRGVEDELHSRQQHSEDVGLNLVQITVILRYSL